MAEFAEFDTGIIAEPAENKIFKVNIKKIPFGREKVDIIIPFHNNFDDVSKLIQSIILSVKSNPYRITIVDNGSTNSEFVKEFKNFDKNRPIGTIPILQTVRSEKNLGFGGGVLLGLEATVNPWVLVMHSDCLVEEPNFMLEMGQSMLKLKDRGVKLISSKTNKCSCFDPRIISEKSSPREDIILEENFAPLFCFLVSRELFRRIGPIKRYPYTGYEDEEFFHRMKFNNFKQAICGKAWVSHKGGGTTKKLLENPKIKAEIEKNRDRCLNDLKNLYSNQ